jgi:type III secretory pathway component EscV
MMFVMILVRTVILPTPAYQLTIHLAIHLVIHLVIFLALAYLVFHLALAHLANLQTELHLDVTGMQ